MEFTYADTLKKQFRVLGHFYNSVIGGHIFQCRSSLEIICKSILDSHSELPDVVVIMMNPGSSRPIAIDYKPASFSPDEIFSCKWEKEIIPTRPDNAQYQIMRLMVLNNWCHAKVLNLSDLRNGNSGELSKEFEMASVIDPSNPHCITHASRRVELENELKTKPGGPVIAAWGSVKVLKESAITAIELLPELIGLKLDHPWYRYPSPYRKDQKLDWLKKMDEIVKKQPTIFNDTDKKR